MNKAALVMARLHFTAFVLSKNIDENKMPKFTLLFNYFAGLDFSPHLEGREGGYQIPVPSLNLAQISQLPNLKSHY